MKNNKNIIVNVIIILTALGSAILNIVDGLTDRINLIEFILSCLLILIGSIGIGKEIKSKNSEK